MSISKAVTCTAVTALLAISLIHVAAGVVPAADRAVKLPEAELSDALTIHVSPAGDDAADGSADAPLASLEAARDRVREMRRTDGGRAAIVHVHAGLHERDAAFRLDEGDSGTADAPIIYRGHAPGDAAHDPVPARLTGGRLLHTFEPVTNDDILARLPQAAHEHVVQADLPAHGITEFGTLQRRGFTQHGAAALELFVDGEPMTLARWPNRGWTTIVAAPSENAAGDAARTITYAGDRPDRWTDAPDPWAFGYWYHGWADEHMPIDAIDTEHQQLTLGARHNYGFREQQRFYVYNLLEELDTPGQWYLDCDAGRLYLWPPEGVDLAEAEVMASVLDEPLIVAEDVSHVRFENLTLDGTRETAVTVSGGEGVTIAGCVIRNVGRHGVTVSGGRNHRVQSCDLYHLGERGIQLAGGDRQSLTPANHAAVNNHIHHFSRWARTYRPALQLSGVGQTAEHNLIHDAPHMAVGFGGNDHRIAYNEIHHVLTQTDDAGALYIGRDWTMRGHVIEHNFIRHSGNQHAPHRREDHPEPDAPHLTLEPLETHGTNLVYLDDAASGITIRGNLLHDGGRSLMIGGGRDNRAENNIVIGGNMAIWMDARGLGWASDHIKRGGHWGIWDRLEAVPYAEPPYRDRYPGLADLPENDPHAPVGNRFARNLLIDNEQPIYFQHDVGHYADLDDNLELQGHADAPGALSADALRDLAEQGMKLPAAQQIDFKPIPLEEIGLHEDAYRSR